MENVDMLESIQRKANLNDSIILSHTATLYELALNKAATKVVAWFWLFPEFCFV